MNQKEWKRFWNSGNDESWRKFEQGYDSLLNKENMKVEKELESFDVNKMWKWSAETFYEFLYDKYFVWKYTAKNRLATTRKRLKEISQVELSFLLKMLKLFQKELMAMDVYDEDMIRMGFRLVTMIPGLGIAGASGLLAIMFPEYYGTVDQFVVYSLDEAGIKIEVKNPESLSLAEAVALERILYEKAKEINKVNRTEYWTPRKIDKILWTHRTEK